jgi:hypothetical protein
MAGDISRSSFQRLKGNTGVRMQQGRVQLDADWNEQLDIQAYRERALTSDLLGSAAPASNAGFAITANRNALAIGPGRMYVDGILCESAEAHQVMPSPVHSGPTPVPGELSNPGMSLVPSRPGIASISFANRVDLARQLKFNLLPEVAASNVLAKARMSSSATSPFNAGFISSAGSAASSIATPSAGSSPPAAAALPLQPYLPSLPSSFLPGSFYVAFLDVWERDITTLEDPSIREIALGGPDTTTRTRVVWQVRLAQQAASTCPTDLASLVSASTGAMSARAEASPNSSNPCVIPASAGYRSLENQLYRVEVHAPGKAGTATFKWSRDNATITAAWQGGDTDLSVSSLGRDDVLGFAGGQWVELTDNTHEYAGTPGILVQLSNAQLVGQVPTLSLDTTSTSQVIRFNDFSGTPKVRRWDQTATATTTLKAGALPVVEGQWIDLEKGVQVYFQPGGNYNTGDFWLIPARTATTASQPTVLWPVDSNDTPLSQAPDGIHHHYTPLAVAAVDSQGNWSVSCDCRSTFAPITTPAAVDVLSVITAEKSPIHVRPFIELSPLSLLAGFSIACDQPLSAAMLNVGTLSVRIDLPETDEKFAESTVPGQQVPAAVSVKVMGNYGLSSDTRTATWIPFPSSRAYFLNKLAAFGALTATQGRALVRLTVHTSALKAGYCSGTMLGDGEVFSLSAWTLPYMDNTSIPEPIFQRLFAVIGPDASGDYIAVGFMTGPLFAVLKALPPLDVAGNKIYSSPIAITPTTTVYAFVPTAAERAGNFSAFSLPITDPRTGLLFPGNQIPQSAWPGSAAGALGVFAWRFRAYVPAPTHAYGYGYGYAGNSALGGELI